MSLNFESYGHNTDPNNNLNNIAGSPSSRGLEWAQGARFLQCGMSLRCHLQLIPGRGGSDCLRCLDCCWNQCCDYGIQKSATMQGVCVSQPMPLKCSSTRERKMPQELFEQLLHSYIIIVILIIGCCLHNHNLFTKTILQWNLLYCTSPRALQWKEKSGNQLLFRQHLKGSSIPRKQSVTDNLVKTCGCAAMQV